MAYLWSVPFLGSWTNLNLNLNKPIKCQNITTAFAILQKVIEEDGQQCTPLIIAARYGHEKVIKMLLSKFHPDLEKEGIVKFDGYVIEGASALWCAAGAGKS